MHSWNIADSATALPSDSRASIRRWVLRLKVNLDTPVLHNSLVLSMVSTDLFKTMHKALTVSLGINSAGSAIGCAVCSYCADKFSRKRTIQGAAMVLIVGAAICAAAVDNAMFLVGRLINGLGIGALVAAIPMYQAEVSTPESRGFMVSMHVCRSQTVSRPYVLGSNERTGCHVRHGLHLVGLAGIWSLLHFRERVQFVVSMEVSTAVYKLSLRLMMSTTAF